MLLSFLFVICVLIILLMFGQKLSKRGNSDLSAIQSAHQRATVRFGGVAIFCGLSPITFSNSWSSVETLILLSGLPIFIAGLLEDITGGIKPRTRLLAAFGSAGLAVLLTGVYLQSGDFWLLDKLFNFPVFAIPITLLISAGITNSFNIIDGINGFCASISLLIAGVLGYVCQIYNEPALSYFCYMIAIACIPFLLFNFPFGLIFLGDAGAYTLGHLLGWIAIVLCYRHPEISSWAILLLFFWPATEVLFSIFRRFMSKTPSGAPDSFHFHQLLMQLLQLRFGGRKIVNGWANPVSTVLILPLASVPIVVSLFVFQNNKVAIFVYLICVVSYFALYVFLLKRVKRIALRAGQNEIVEPLDHIFTPSKK